MFDPKTGKYTFIDLCFGTQHLNFAYDANDTLWFSGGAGDNPVGWLNTKMFEETGDAAKSQGWTSLIVDTSGNGKRDEYTEPGKPLEPGKDMRIGQTIYAVMPDPKDGSIWGSLWGTPGGVVKIIPGANPPMTTLTEIYKVPMPGFGVRGADIDSKGVVWVSLASGHMGAFDRRKCKVLNGPTATGDHCPEGWSFYQYPGPGFEGIGENSAEFELLFVGRPAQHLRPRRGRSGIDRQPQRRPHRPQGRQDGHHQGAVSDRLLRQRARWPHRRSQHRLEGPRLVDLQRRPRALDAGRRQGHEADGRALPDEARSARPLSGGQCAIGTARRCRAVVRRGT